MAAALAVVPVRRLDAAAALAAVLTAAIALAVAVVALAGWAPTRGDWYVLDGATGVYLAVVAVVGLLSTLASGGHLAMVHASFFTRGAPQRTYYVLLALFWG